MNVHSYMNARHRSSGRQQPSFRGRWYHFCASPSAVRAVLYIVISVICVCAYNWSERRRRHGPLLHAFKTNQQRQQRGRKIVAWRQNEEQSTNHFHFRSISTQYTLTRMQTHTRKWNAALAPSSLLSSLTSIRIIIISIIVFLCVSHYFISSRLCSAAYRERIYSHEQRRTGIETHQSIRAHGKLN